MTSAASLGRYLSIAKLGRYLTAARDMDDPAARASALREVATRMASLHGLPQKIGQLLGLFTADEISAAELLSLTSRGEAVPSEEFRRWLIDGLGAERAKAFTEVDPNGFAASIGQVHRARLTSGEVVAVKVQYPGLRSAINSDLKLLNLVSLPLRARADGRGVVSYDIEAYRHELAAALNEELDYRAEHDALVRMHTRELEIPMLRTPSPFSALCSDTVLTMEWVDGVSIDRLHHVLPSLRAVVARTLLQLFLRGWLRWGEVHADPHAGNFRIQTLGDRVRVGVLDFGCMKRVDIGEQMAARSLLCAPPATSEGALEICSALGFKPELLHPMRHKLPRLLQVLTLPFSTNGEFDLETWRLTERMGEILGDDRWNFRLAGPPALTFVLRAFAGMCAHIRTLGVPINWQRELFQVIAEPEPIQVDHPRATKIIETEAVFLSVRVLEGGRVKVQVTLPGSAVDDLQAIVPPEVRAAIEKRGVDLAALGRTARREGWGPRELFSLIEEEREVSVALISSP